MRSSTIANGSAASTPKKMTSTMMIQSGTVVSPPTTSAAAVRPTIQPRNAAMPARHRPRWIPRMRLLSQPIAPIQNGRRSRPPRPILRVIAAKVIRHGP